MNAAISNTPSGKLRARGLGLQFSGVTGLNNSITDVPGVSVGYTTIIQGQGPLNAGYGPIRTGVTAILPRCKSDICHPVFAGYFNFNGNGELSGAHYLDEVGQLSFPITITNTNSCGISRDATLKWAFQSTPGALTDNFALPVAAETYDGFLNDINGFHINAEHVFSAIDNASQGPIEEGSVGGGTGMKCFEFKAGSGTASRQITYAEQSYTVGTFVQANFGQREDLTILGKNIGLQLKEPRMTQNTPVPDLSSIIVVIATDAPLLPHQLQRLARRATLGMARLGTSGDHSSGDLFLAFSTANQQPLSATTASVENVKFIPDQQLDPFFAAVVQGVEEAIINSMVANQAMTGRDGNSVPALPHKILSLLAETS